MLLAYNVICGVGEEIAMETRANRRAFSTSYRERESNYAPQKSNYAPLKSNYAPLKIGPLFWTSTFQSQ